MLFQVQHNAMERRKSSAAVVRRRRWRGRRGRRRRGRRREDESGRGHRFRPRVRLQEPAEYHEHGLIPAADPDSWHRQRQAQRAARHRSPAETVRQVARTATSGSRHLDGRHIRRIGCFRGRKLRLPSAGRAQASALSKDVSCIGHSTAERPKIKVATSQISTFAQQSKTLKLIHFIQIFR